VVAFRQRTRYSRHTRGDRHRLGACRNARLRSTTDAITIVLVEPEGMPPSVIIHSPGQPTVCSPLRFPQLAAAAMRVLAKASTALASIRAGRKL
jgi:hypothetical protein